MGSDSLIPSDKRTMEVLREIGKSTHPWIQLEVYHPSHEDGKMTISDLKLWVQEIGPVLWQTGESQKSIFCLSPFSFVW